MTNTPRARDLAEKLDLRRPVKGFGSPQSHEALIADRNAANTKLIAAALDAAWQEGVEAAARWHDGQADEQTRLRDASNQSASLAPEPGGAISYYHSIKADTHKRSANVIRALLPPDPVTAPGHTDLMVAPESVDTPVCETCGGRREVSHFVGSIGSGGEGYQVDLCPDCTPDRDAPDAVGALAVLRSYEQWEADMIMENRAWTRTNGLPHITQELWNRLLEIQTARNAALALARPQK